MATVNIEGVTYDVYGSLSAADAYFAAALHATSWAAVLDDDDQRAKSLVTATRMLDRARWVGTKTSPSQALEWPRTGVTDRYGVPLSDSAVPVSIENGCYELANLLLGDSSIQNATSSGSNVKSVEAGSAAVEFFRSTSNSSTRFPTIVHELIGQFLAGGDGLGIVATGLGTSAFSEYDYGYNGEGLP